MECALLVRNISVIRQDLGKRNQCVLYRLVRIEVRKPIAHIFLHERTIAIVKLRPANMLRIRGKIAKKCR